MCSHEIQKIKLGGDSFEQFMFGIGGKYKNVTCNSAPHVLEHAAKYIKKKFGKDLFLSFAVKGAGKLAMTAGAGAGACAGAVSTSTMGGTALTSVVLPAAGVISFIGRLVYLGEFSSYEESFFKELDRVFGHLKMEPRSDRKVYFLQDNVCDWCKSNNQPWTYHYGGMTDGIFKK